MGMTSFPKASGVSPEAAILADMADTDLDDRVVLHVTTPCAVFLVVRTLRSDLDDSAYWEHLQAVYVPEADGSIKHIMLCAYTGNTASPRLTTQWFDEWMGPYFTPPPAIVAAASALRSDPPGVYDQPVAWAAKFRARATGGENR